MAQEAPEVKVKVLSPEGTAVFPHLVQPDTKYNAEGEYTTKLRVEAGAAQGLIDSINGVWAKYAASLKGAAKKKAPTSLGYAIEYDDDGEETGYVLFKFATYATYKDKKTKEIKQKNVKMFDSAGAPTSPERLWGGSKLVISATAKSYIKGINAGVKLYLDAVMIIDLVDGNDGGAESYGFDTAGGGYKADNFQNSHTPEDDSDDAPFDPSDAANDDF